MNTMLDYILFRGDLSMDERPAGEVDYAVLCQCMYLDLKPVYRGDNRSFRQLTQELIDRNEICVLPLGDREAQAEAIRQAGMSQRFGSLILRDFVDLLDAQAGVQFSVGLWDISDTVQCIVFRGTDNSVAGWREDFEISYTRSVAQVLAANYVKEHLSQGKRTVLTGHSKGGNLAQYAAECLTEEEFSQIEHIYLYDSPGLEEAVAGTGRNVIRMPICSLYVPQYCVVGNILADPEANRKIVPSSYFGFMQHGPLSWGIRGAQFEEAGELEAESVHIKQILDYALRDLNLDEREEFVNALFDSVQKAGIVSLDQFAEHGPKSFERVLVQMAENNYSFTTEFLNRPVKELRSARIHDNLSRWFHAVSTERKKAMQHLALILFGTVFLMVPNSIISLVPAVLLVGITAVETIHTVYLLFRNRFNLQQERVRISFCAILLAVSLVSFMKNNTLFLMGSLIFGVLFLLMAVYTAQELRVYRRFTSGFWLVVGKTLLYILYGLFVLVAPEWSMKWYCCNVGIFLAADGISRIAMMGRDTKG